MARTQSCARSLEVTSAWSRAVLGCAIALAALPRTCSLTTSSSCRSRASSAFTACRCPSLGAAGPVPNSLARKGRSAAACRVTLMPCDWIHGRLISPVARRTKGACARAVPGSERDSGAAPMDVAIVIARPLVTVGARWRLAAPPGRHRNPGYGQACRKAPLARIAAAAGPLGRDTPDRGRGAHRRPVPGRRAAVDRGPVPDLWHPVSDPPGCAVPDRRGSAMGGRPGSERPHRGRACARSAPPPLARAGCVVVVAVQRPGVADDAVARPGIAQDGCGLPGQGPDRPAGGDVTAVGNLSRQTAGGAGGDGRYRPDERPGGRFAAQRVCHLGQAANEVRGGPCNVRCRMLNQPGRERDEGSDERLGLGFALRLRGGVAEVLHHGVRVHTAKRVGHRLALVLELAFPFVLELELVLVFLFALELVLVLALAEESADDAAEVEVLALVFVFEFELAERAVLRGAHGHDVLSFLAWRASAVAVSAAALWTPVRMPVRAPGVAAWRCRGPAHSPGGARVALERGGGAPGAAEHATRPAAHHLSGHAAVDRAAGGRAPGQVACRALDDGRHRSDGRPRSAPPPQEAGEHARRAHQVGQQAAQLGAVPGGQHGHGSRADHGLGLSLGLGPGGYRGHHLGHRLGLAHRVRRLVLALVLVLVFVLALAEESADDAAEVEVLALFLALELPLELVLELTLAERAHRLAGQRATERPAEGGAHHGRGDPGYLLEQRRVLPYEAGDAAEELLRLVLVLPLTEESADDAAEVEVLALFLLLALALAEEPTDDAAEVEVLALFLALVLLFALELVLELGLQLGL